MVGTAPVKSKVKEVNIKAKTGKAKVIGVRKATVEVKIKVKNTALGRGKVWKVKVRKAEVGTLERIANG